MDWRVDALQRRLDTLLPGLRVEIVAKLASTNTELLQRARGAASITPCLLVAEEQSGGRGRLGRHWHSAPGASLTFSLLLPLAAADWSGLSLAVGVALADALELEPLAGAPRIGLKWPNDLWLVDAAPPVDGGIAGAAPRPASAGRKLGGILIETVAAGPTRLAVIGIGLNLGPQDARLPEISSGYASLSELGDRVDAPAVLERVAPALLEALPAFERGGFGAFRARYAARDVLQGRPVRTTQPGAEAGIARGVADDGCLLLQTPHGLQRVSSGEVSVRFEDQGAAHAPSAA